MYNYVDIILIFDSMYTCIEVHNVQRLILSNNFQQY